MEAATDQEAVVVLENNNELLKILNMENFLNNEYVVMVYQAVAYILAAFILFFIGKLFYKLFHRKINIKEELVKKDNLAFSIAHTGYFIGLIIAIGAAIVGPSHGFVIDMIDLGVYGILSIILLNISTIINDKVILRKFSVHKEIIEDQNVGTGVIEAASAIGSGLIIYGAVTGESNSLLFGVFSAILFWAVGQVLIILTSYIYNWFLSFDIHEHIEKDNVAVGIGFAGAIVAISNLIRFALMGEFIDFATTFTDVGIEMLIGILLLPVVRFLADKILLPGEKLTDEIVNQEKPNVGAAIIEAFAYIGGSILITWCI